MFPDWYMLVLDVRELPPLHSSDWSGKKIARVSVKGLLQRTMGGRLETQWWTIDVCDFEDPKLVLWKRPPAQIELELDLRNPR